MKAVAEKRVEPVVVIPAAARETCDESTSSVCPVLSCFVNVWSDGLPADEDRSRLLRPLMPRLPGTRAARECEERRAWLAFDWLVRVRTLKWLELAPELHEHAKTLRALHRILLDLGEITDLAGAVTAGERLKAAQIETAAVWESLRDSVGRAVRAPAREAMRASGWDAAWAAWRLACDDVRDAASAAAWVSAWETMWVGKAAAWGVKATAGDSITAAAQAHLAPTVQSLQASALELIDRMLAVVPVQAAREDVTSATPWRATLSSVSR